MQAFIKKYANLILVISVIIAIFIGDYFYSGSDFNGFFNYPKNIIKFNYYVLFFGLYFFNFYYICPRYFSLKKIVHYLLSTIFLMFLFVALRYLLDEIILFKTLGLPNYGDLTRGFSNYVYTNLLDAFKAISYSSSLFFFMEYFKNKNKIHQLELDHKKAEIAYLKSQISPHFLFNTLNAFYVELIDDKPETAKDIHKLSELLRFVTYESQEDFLSLKSEIKFLEDYVYFYYKRFEDQLFVDFKVDGLVGIQQIPSLILIHFVENVFKHGIINDKENKALIHINITTDYIELTTKNKFIISEKYTSKGIGKSNIERRLKAIYKTNFTLNYSDENEYFTSYVKIPLK